MPRQPKNKAAEAPKPVVAAPPQPVPVAPAKAPPVIDVDNFIRVRDSVSNVFASLVYARTTSGPRTPTWRHATFSPGRDAQVASSY